MHPASTTLFGLSPILLSAVIFVATYAAVISEKLNRAIVALLGAGLMILTGVVSQESAIAGVDFNTLGLLAGMMMIVSIMRKTGVFQFVAIWSAKKVKANPWGVLMMLAVVTAVFSALLDNVTTVLLVVPVTLLITEELGVEVYPYLFATILSSNVGGTATLIGDPPNIMIGSAAGLSFADFLLHLTPVVVVVFVATLLPIYLLWGRKLKGSEEGRERVMAFNEGDAITDARLLRKSLVVLALVIAGFVFHHAAGLQPATVAMIGAALLLAWDNLGRNGEEQGEAVHHAFTEVEWVTLFFFVGLFIVVHGIESAGIIHLAAQQLLAATGGNLAVMTMVVLWGSAILSAIVDNIPFVATMIPLLKSMAPSLGGEHALIPLWWSLALGACLGGNGTLIGASANLVVAGFAERSGHTISFVGFLKTAFPMMLLSIAICSVYVYLRYL